MCILIVILQLSPLPTPLLPPPVAAPRQALEKAVTQAAVWRWIVHGARLPWHLVPRLPFPFVSPSLWEIAMNAKPADLESPQIQNGRGHVDHQRVWTSET